VRTLRRELQDSIEAFEAGNEELKAANEEVTSINEELQSTNEELETGKEELQSVNEELTTVNNQLQTKIADLEATTNDLANLLGSTDIAVVFLDAQFRVRRFTPAVSDLLDLIDSDIGRPITDLAQKFTDEKLLDDSRAVLQRLIPVETEIRSHSGRWYLRRTLPYRTSENRIEGVVITFIDIGARKRAEQDVLAAQERTRAVLEQMPAAVLLVDAPSGKVTFANQSAADLFRQPFPTPLVQRDWASFYGTLGVHPRGRPYQPEEWPITRSLASGNTISDEEIEVLRADGTRSVLSVSSAPVRNDAGNMVAVAGVFWDVTQRRRSEQVLRETEERFRLLVDSARDFAIFFIDIDGCVATWNPGAERLLGWTEAEIIGQSAAALFTAADRETGVPEREVRRATQAGQAVDERWHVRRDGSPFWASGVLAAAHDAAGAVCGFVKIMRDDTERKQVEDRLYAATADAEHAHASAVSANKAKDDFIATVSHELRTPLNTIRLWVRMLESDKLSDIDRVEGVRTIERAAIAQQQVIEDLLDVSRIASGKLRLAPRDTRLAEAIQGAVSAVRPIAGSRGLRLECDLAGDIGVVRADPDRIQQIVWNLLSNAVKFTPAGGTVRVAGIRKGPDIEISVTDSGIGINPAFLPHVFDRFRQAEAGAARQHSGLGLGLAIARQLAQLHGGDIGADSEGEGRGATFTVYLPLPVRLEEALQADVDVASPPIDLTGIEVLLVEDEPSTLATMRRLLERKGARVRAVESAAAARTAFAAQRPDVIVSDIGLPGEDGYAFLKDLRARCNGADARVPSLALTAFARVEDRKQALAAGFDEHLTKPVDTERLIAVIAALARRPPQAADTKV
jgi:two-component system CheB/CheR fusion protein